MKHFLNEESLKVMILGQNLPRLQNPRDTAPLRKYKIMLLIEVRYI